MHDCLGPLVDCLCGNPRGMEKLAICPHLLKGKFPQTTMWIGWVESNFTNPTVKVWADLDNPIKRSDYAKLFMSPSLDGTLPEYVISQEDNSPLTLYIDFHFFSFFLGYQQSFWSSSFINACTFISALTYLSIKEEGKICSYDTVNLLNKSLTLWGLTLSQLQICRCIIDQCALYTCLVVVMAKISPKIGPPKIILMCLERAKTTCNRVNVVNV